MTISNENMRKMFSYMEEHNPSKNTNYNASKNSVVYGEELRGYVPYSNANLARSVMVRDPLAHVKYITNQITMMYYDGDSKFVSEVAGVYEELIEQRKKRGFKGLHGKNIKGIICAILYMLLYSKEQSRLNVQKLIKSANQVKTQAITRVTTRMVFNYLTFVLSYLYVNDDGMSYNNIDGDDLYKELDEEIKRYSIMLKINIRERFKIKHFAHVIMKKSPKLSDKRVDKVASSIIYVYLLKNGAELSKYDKVSLKTKLKITPYVVSNILPLIMNYTVHNNNVSIPRFLQSNTNSSI